MTNDNINEAGVLKKEIKFISDSLAESVKLIKSIENSLCDTDAGKQDEIMKSAELLKSITEETKLHYEKIKNLIDK